MRCRCGCKEGHVLDDEILKILLDRLLLDSGVEILYHALVAGADSKERSISGKWAASTSSSPLQGCAGVHDHVAFSTFKS
ncbi:MAG: hypothetical protein WAX69_14215 [Victivallales bacterium]